MRARVLLDADAAVFKANHGGETPLQVAERKGFEEVAEILRNAQCHSFVDAVSVGDEADVKRLI